MHPLTKVLAAGWLAVAGVLGAHYAGVSAAAAPSASLLNYSAGFLSPVSLFGMASVAWLALAFFLASGRKEKLNRSILKDRPKLEGDRKALARERRIRLKEAQLQKREIKTLAAEDRSEARIKKEVAREGKQERKREVLEAKKEELAERRSAGR